ncbi:RNA-directed DNA polymerase (Reverse transcriptase), Ribonuclease H [Gossypium australe]|uniref:RNA-directed DNA polymerase (Reverse transcriptase), Ribonuclease H n=1 Tax=Gossypium australe TaxID=47621 RepID=A0A5B6WES8_9ROSI|nr:RNA-directed DNA polymerase (Reverse transcriptase), Ribonuclease H [Gossypium australe]
MPNWEGPYVVKKAFSRGALILIEMDGKTLPNPVNLNSVQKYFTRRNKKKNEKMKSKRRGQGKNPQRAP